MVGPIKNYFFAASLSHTCRLKTHNIAMYLKKIIVYLPLYYLSASLYYINILSFKKLCVVYWRIKNTVNKDKLETKLSLSDGSTDTVNYRNSPAV